MKEFDRLWTKLRNKKYREEFVAAQVKRGIPFQIRKLMKQEGLSQQELAARAGLTQGVVSRAADPEYGNLTLNTIIRIAAGFDVGFVGRFVPVSEVGNWFLRLPEECEVKTFPREDAERATPKPVQNERGSSLCQKVQPSRLAVIQGGGAERAAMKSVQAKQDYSDGTLAGLLGDEPVKSRAEA